MNTFDISTGLILLQVLIGYNLILPFLFFIISVFRKPKIKKALNVKKNRKQLDYAIIVTAYEQTHMLPEVISSLLNLNYKNYHIYVVADNCKHASFTFVHSQVSVLYPEEVLSSNTKSHFYAINRFVREHEIVTIIDSDNLVHRQYLIELNKLFEQGFSAVQGVRQAKNLNTTIACLDAARDIYYNFYDGYLLFKLGSSSTLAGSGMAFKTRVYKECLENVIIEGAGFDKVLQAQLLKKGYRIAYASKAVVYDGKTTHSQQLVSQRARWINTWFKYVKHGFELVILGIWNRKLNQFLFGLILLRPPLFIFILLSVLCLVLSIFVNPLHTFFWLIAFCVFVFGFIIALKSQNSSKNIYRSLRSIPVFIFYQLVSLYYSRTANRRSVATKHAKVDSFN